MTSIKHSLLLAALSATVCFVPASHAAILLSENFDSMTTGVSPSGWTVSQPTNTSVLVTDTQFVSGLNSLQLHDASTAAGFPAASASFDQVTSGVVTVNLDMRATVTTRDALYVKLRNSLSQDLGGIRFNTNGTFAYMAAGGTWTASSVTYTADTWYSLEITFDLDAKTYSASVGGSSVVENAAFRSTATVFDANALALQSFVGVGSFVGDAFVDNITISTIPEPSTTTAAAGLLTLLAACCRRRRS